MTNGEKMMITQQRRQGLGYTEIARRLGMSVIRSNPIASATA